MSMDRDQDDSNTKLTLAKDSGHFSAVARHDNMRSNEELKIVLKLRSIEYSDPFVRKERVNVEETGCKNVQSKSPFNQDRNGAYVAATRHRYSTVQLELLEKTMNEHSTVNAEQRIELAAKLGITPRQVQIWFQNRRASMKLRRVDQNVEFLKRCCQTLTQENMMLKKDLQELTAASPATIPAKPFSNHLQSRPADCTVTVAFTNARTHVSYPLKGTVDEGGLNAARSKLECTTAVCSMIDGVSPLAKGGESGLDAATPSSHEHDVET